MIWVTPSTQIAEAGTCGPSFRRFQFRGFAGRAAAAAGLALALGLGSATQQASTAAARGRRSSRRQLARRPDRAVGAANACLRQHQLNLASRRMVAGEFGHDRAHLLIAGRHQEGRRATIGFRADDGEAGFGVREFGDAVRRHGAAGMEVRIDERRESRRCLDCRIELDAQLAQEGEVGPEAGRDDDAIDVERERLAAERAPRRTRRPLDDGVAAKGASIFNRPSSMACLAARPSAPRSGS